MKYIETKVEYINKKKPLEQIEYVGRVCYESRDRITETSALPFCENLYKFGHTTPFEHARIMLPCATRFEFPNSYGIMDRLGTVIMKECGKLRQTVNCRDALAFGYSVAELADMDISGDGYTFELTIPISIAREFVRHRTFSFMERSTRYCDMSDLEVILDDSMQNLYGPPLLFAEEYYATAIQNGAKRQFARDILPLCTATKLVMTGMACTWEAFFKLRCSSAAHPLANKIATEIREKYNQIRESEK